MRSIFAVTLWLLLSAATADAQSGCGTVSANVKPPASKELYAVVIREVDGTKVEGRSSAGQVKLSAGPHRITVQELIADDRRGRAKLAELGVAKGPPGVKTLEVDVNADGSYLIAAQLVENAADSAQPGDHWAPLVWRKLVDSCK